MKQKAVKHPLLQEVHPKLAFAVLAIALLTATGVYLYTESQSFHSSYQPPAVTPVPTTQAHLSPIPAKVVWHFNTTQEWATYASSDVPFTFQFPPQWGYSGGGGAIGGDLLVHQAPSQDETYDNGILIGWGGSYGGPNGCTAHPSIQLKNETLPACEYSDGKGNDRMQIDKVTPTLNLIIRTSTSNETSKSEILQILSTLSFTK